MNWGGLLYISMSIYAFKENMCFFSFKILIDIDDKYKMDALNSPKAQTCLRQRLHESRYEISNNIIRATSTALDQPAHMRSLIRAFASRMNIFKCKATYRTLLLIAGLNGSQHRLDRLYTCHNTTLLKIICR